MIHLRHVADAQRVRRRAGMAGGELAWMEAGRSGGGILAHGLRAALSASKLVRLHTGWQCALTRWRRGALFSGVMQHLWLHK